MRIIIVDNDTALLRSLELVLSAADHSVYKFKSAETALEFIRQNGSPDVVMVDYVMPGMTGEELLLQLKDILSDHCRVILVSGHTDLIEPLDLKSLGVDVFLPKPIDLEQMNMLLWDRGQSDLGPNRNFEDKRFGWMRSTGRPISSNG